MYMYSLYINMYMCVNTRDCVQVFPTILGFGFGLHSCSDCLASTLRCCVKIRSEQALKLMGPRISEYCKRQETGSRAHEVHGWPQHSETRTAKSIASWEAKQHGFRLVDERKAVEPFTLMSLSLLLCMLAFATILCTWPWSESLSALPRGPQAHSQQSGDQEY